MTGLKGILWQEWVVFKRKFWGTTLGMIVSPLLYLVAFGWGLGQGLTVEGMPYMDFMIPGLVALNTMIVSFNNCANNINISKLYYKTFENYLLAPIPLSVFILGKVLTGAGYGLYSASLIVLMTICIGKVQLVTPYFIGMMVANALVFSACGFLAGMMVKSHGDMAKFTSFVITPMSFLCGTFFSLSQMPWMVKGFIQLLPLTHSAAGMRMTGHYGAEAWLHFGVLAVYFIGLMMLNLNVLRNVES